MPLFLPLKDDNELKVVAWQIVTATFIALCVAAYLYQLILPEIDARIFQLRFAFIPELVFRDLPPEQAVLDVMPDGLRFFTAAFLHADFLHLAGNMLFLWVYGDNVEDAMGHFRFAAFYLICGAASCAAQGIVEPDSAMIGASGAVAGVLGAYLALHPKVKVLTLVGVGFIRAPLRLPAWLVLGSWIAFQFYALWSIPDSNVAWSAHVGGFLAGVLLVGKFRRKDAPSFDRPRPDSQSS